MVFCPPIATFSDSKKADEKSLVNGLALSVECDQHAAVAREKLEALLGPATVVVASGGKWTNPATGEIEDKLHLHWRLTEPTRTPEDHRLLKQARTLAASLVGGDASNKPIVHPIRWPGSWHRKKTPVLARIISETDSEIELNDALEKLKEALTAAGIDHDRPKKDKTAKNENAETGESRDTTRLVEEILQAKDFHAPLVALAMRFLKGGMADGQATLILRGIMDAVPQGIRDGMQPGRWQTRYDDIPRAVSSAREKISSKEMTLSLDSPSSQSMRINFFIFFLHPPFVYILFYLFL
ncbi:MAG: hypothetical protein HY052_08565 [Proteobacteria bacterium]|nr:hypothetical protein [Pseudomonadota bacterium]